MKAVIVCYYADLGRPYAPLIARMTDSARAVMPDARLVLLTPTPECSVRALFDEVAAIDRPTTLENLCLERARATSSWAAQCDVPTIFTDPDIEFLRPVEIDGTYDIGLLWREKPDQPVNGGLVIAMGRRTKFWLHYGEIVLNLPRKLHPWWCDQIAYSLLTGVCHRAGDGLMIDDARVRLLDMAQFCPLSDERRSPWVWGIHHKGRRKGPTWDQIFRGEEAA